LRYEIVKRAETDLRFFAPADPFYGAVFEGREFFAVGRNGRKSLREVYF